VWAPCFKSSLISAVEGIRALNRKSHGLHEHNGEIHNQRGGQRHHYGGSDETSAQWPFILTLYIEARRHAGCQLFSCRECRRCLRLHGQQPKGYIEPHEATSILIHGGVWRRHGPSITAPAPMDRWRCQRTIMAPPSRVKVPAPLQLVWRSRVQKEQPARHRQK